MTLLDYYKTHNRNFDKTRAAAYVIGKPAYNDVIRVMEFVRNCKIEFEIPPKEERLGLLQKVNKQIKDPDCPKNIMYKFYMYKHKILKLMFANGQVDKVLESANHYHFFIGDYDFHQPKTYFPKGIDKIDGTEVYEPRDATEKFNHDDYVRCMLGLIEELPMRKH